MKSFLSTVHLEGLYDVLKENQVAFQDLPLLTKDDLMDLEVPIGPRNRLLKAVKVIEQDTLDCKAHEYEESLRGTGRFRTSEEVRLRQDRYAQLEELLMQLSHKQVQMMQLIEENQRSIADIMMVTYTQSSRESRDLEAQVPTQLIETSSRSRLRQPYSKVSPLRITSFDYPGRAASHRT
jgi:hypothetical protein